jgi:thiosulfate dehydrogenase
VIVGALVLGACSTTEEPGKVIDRTPAEQGKALFSSPRFSNNSFNSFACSDCHATADTPAAGRTLAGADLDGVLARPAFWGGAETDPLRAINDCLKYFMLDSAGLDPGDASAGLLFAYLSGLPATTTTAVPFTVVASVAEVPVGDADRGKEVYDRACRSCHGDLHTAAGRLAEVVSLLPEETIREHGTYGPEELRLTGVEKIRHGSFLGYGGQMPPFSREVLSDAEVGDLLSYLGFLPP